MLQVVVSLLVSSKETYKASAGPNEIVVQTKALGINHIDYKIQDYAVFPLTYPTP
jgi:NADPH:quinone reductase-like Zn-dependent oxidoreductase